MDPLYAWFQRSFGFGFIAAPAAPSPFPVGPWQPAQYCWKATFPLAASPPAKATPPPGENTRIATAAVTTPIVRIPSLLQPALLASGRSWLRLLLWSIRSGRQDALQGLGRRLLPFRDHRHRPPHGGLRRIVPDVHDPPPRRPGISRGAPRAPGDDRLRPVGPGGGR